MSMWSPPWRTTALSAPVSDADMQIAREAADRVAANIAAGRPFYVDPTPAFVERFRKNQRGIFYYVKKHPAMPRLTPSGDRATDTDIESVAVRITNKSFYNALRGIRDYRGEAPLTNWFYVIAHNALVDELRVTSRIPAVRARFNTAMAVDALDDNTEDGAATDLVIALKSGTTRAGKRDEEVGNRLREITRLVETLTADRDEFGLPFISPRATKILFAYAAADGDYGVMAKSIGASPLGAQNMVRTALIELQSGVTRLKNAKSDARARRGPIRMVDWR